MTRESKVTPSVQLWRAYADKFENRNESYITIDLTLSFEQIEVALDDFDRELRNEGSVETTEEYIESAKGFYGFDVSKYFNKGLMNIYQMYEVAQHIINHDEKFVAYWEDTSGSIQYTLDTFNPNAMDVFEDKLAYADYYVMKLGIKDIHVLKSIDYEALADSLLRHRIYWISEETNELFIIDKENTEK